MYAPGSSASPEELEQLCKTVARHGKVYTSHIRSYFKDLVPAIEEQIELARRSGCRLQISHLQAVGTLNWPQHPLALETIERARDEGIDIAFDCYPYVAGSTVLTQLLPQRVLDRGKNAMLARLHNPLEKKIIKEEIEVDFPWSRSDIFVSAVHSAGNAGAVGQNLQEIAELRSCSPIDAMIDLLIEEEGQVNMLSFKSTFVEADVSSPALAHIRRSDS